MKKDRSTPIVITSIFPPNEVIRQYTELGFQLLIAGDRKTPEPWEHPNCEYLSVRIQQAHFPQFAKEIPLNHYSRKNFAYLEAMQMGVNQIFETDDDNYPQKSFPNFQTTSSVSTQLVQSKEKFFNVYREFSKNKQEIWPRGYPLKKVLLPPAAKHSKKKVTVYIEQSLIDHDTDVDAIYRLTVNKMVKFKKNHSVALDKHLYAPINSQNTAWSKPAFVLLYLPTTVSSRVCDILRGWVAQRLAWELDSVVLFSSPTVYQERNEHDFLKDFKEELPLYLDTEGIIELLDEVKLTGDINEKLIQIYTMLAKEKIVMKEEVKRVKLWTKTCKNLLKNQ